MNRLWVSCAPSPFVDDQLVFANETDHFAELGKFHGFHDVTVGAAQVAFLDVPIFVRRSRHNHGDGFGSRNRLQAIQDLCTVSAGIGLSRSLRKPVKVHCGLIVWVPIPDRKERGIVPPSSVLVPESVLGAFPTVALSSAQVGGVVAVPPVVARARAR